MRGIVAALTLRSGSGDEAARWASTAGGAHAALLEAKLLLKGEREVADDGGPNGSLASWGVDRGARRRAVSWQGRGHWTRGLRRPRSQCTLTQLIGPKLVHLPLSLLLLKLHVGRPLLAHLALPRLLLKLHLRHRRGLHEGHHRFHGVEHVDTTSNYQPNGD